MGPVLMQNRTLPWRGSTNSFATSHRSRQKTAKATFPRQLPNYPNHNPLVQALRHPRFTALSATKSDAFAQPSTVLVLSWFAAGNQSLLAAQCLVECVLHEYQAGATFDEIQMSLELGSISGPDAGVLGEQQLSVLTSWVALVMLTASKMGISVDLERPGRSAFPMSSYLEGMMQYVEQTLVLYESQGYTLARLTALQALTRQDAAEGEGGASPFLALMQQYCRLVVLTLEVLGASAIPSTRPLTHAHSLAGPSGITLAFQAPGLWRSPAIADPLEVTQEATTSDDGTAASEASVPRNSSSSSSSTSSSPPAPSMRPHVPVTDNPADVSSSSECSTPLGGCRGPALYLLLAFMGAVLGADYSMRKFVQAVHTTYTQGLTARDVMEHLEDQDFLQSGGLLPVGVPGPEISQAINRELFATWLSMAYITLAQLGVPHPRAQECDGWAWAGDGDELAAVGLDNFVSHALKRLFVSVDEQEDNLPDVASVATLLAPSQVEGAGGVDLDRAPETDLQVRMRSGLAVGVDDADVALATAMPVRTRDDGFQVVKVEDSALMATSSSAAVLQQQLKLVQVCCEHALSIRDVAVQMA